MCVPIRVFLLVLFSIVPLAQSHVLFGELFPFGEGNGDTTIAAGDDTITPVTLSAGRSFTFFNVSYTNFFVSSNGLISFLQGFSQFTPTCFQPLFTPAIIPYWADINTGIGGNISYRESSSQPLLTKASREIRTRFPDLTGRINLNWIFIVTWHNVSFFGSNANPICLNSTITPADSTLLRNTFQAILTTDGVRSFVFFYYNNIVWTSGVASGGDPCNGLGGNPAKAGYDLGDSTTFFEIPGSCTPAIVNIAETSNVNDPGKWIFRVDGAASV